MTFGRRRISFAALACAAAVIITKPAWAFELIQGHGIKIEGLVQSRSSRETSSTLGASSYQGTPEAAKAYLTVYQGGSVLTWQPLVTPSCTGSEGYTSVAILYDRKGSKSGKFNCLPQQSGSASENSTSKASGAYSSKASVSGDVLTLRGQMTYTDKWDSSGGPFGGTGGSNETTRVTQSVTIRVAGRTCEVLSFSEVALQTKTSRGNPA